MVAEVTLIGSLSHTAKGKKFVKGRLVVVTKASDIEYFKSQPGFKVKMVKEAKKEEAKPKKQRMKAKVAEPKAPVAPKEPVEEVSEVEEAPEPEKEKEPVDELPVGSYDEVTLKGMKKKVLVDVAAELGLFLEGDEKKSDMVAAILKKQSE